MSKTKNKIEKEIIEAWKSLFELYPELKAVPVYAWGRYYKYECAGSSFEYYPEFGFGNFKQLTLKYEIDWNLINKIYLEVSDKIGNCEIGDYLPNRYEIAKEWDWDDRAGQCLIISKNDKNELELQCVSCDSPE